MTEPCRIIGVLDNGPEGLTPAALASLRAADLVIGAERTLALFEGHLAEGAECRDLSGRLTQVPDWIAEARRNGRRVAVLATGDPLCHGIAAYLGDKLGREALAVVPNVSTIQLACARLGLPWQDLAIGSAHSRDAGEWTPGAGPVHGLYGLLQKLSQADLMGVFTSPDNGPDRIARMLLAEGLEFEFEMAVAERLLLPDERIHGWMGIAEAAGRRYADPNVALLRRRPGEREALFGLADARFRQRAPDKGLITKREVRAVSLARLALRPDSIVWDIGAGSGAVGLEAARLCPKGHVYAIEKNAEDFAIALSNRESLRVTNYTLVQAKAPRELDGWPDPHGVFIGGSGGELRELIQNCLRRLRAGGWLVMNFATLENLATAVDALKASGARWDVTQLQASRSRPLLDMHRLQAENPIWIVCAQRGTDE
ncbi:MAG: precorrin-6y C5,15-methyltransferase (decarboxylating) subunit CbiE [Pseudomonadota bacterium]